jgi:hypothetical protein
MNTVRVLYHLALADFLERVRRYSFLLTLAATVYLGYAVIVDDVKLRFGDYRGVNNSAWVGLQMAMCATIFVSLAGFYVVKNTVGRDIQTRVGQILATTPIDKLDYLFGKALSNLGVMAVIVLVLAVAAAVGQFWAGQDLRVELWPLLAPFLLIALPALAFVAALAVFFETLPGLRGGFGNVMYFFLWVFLLTYGPEAHNAFADCLGFGLLESHLKVGLYAQLPDYHGGMGIGILTGLHSYKSFLWQGFAWRIDLVSMRLYWFAVAFALILLAAVLFDRFDPARGFLRVRPISAGPSWWHHLAPWRRRAATADARGDGAMNGAAARKPMVHLSPLSPAALRFRAAAVLLAELRLMLKRQRWWWYVVAAGLLIASLANPAQEARRELLPWVWLWPILIWSAMGTREARHQTDELIFSAAHSLRRQFPAAWLAGVIVAVLMGSGVALRLLLARDWAGLLGFAVGAVFISSLALAMGVWSGTGKLFEAVYIIWWYIGPVHHDRNLDFMFTSPQSFSWGVLRFYILAAFLLFGIAVLGRRRQIQA